jgi:succinate dehydrogenase/fumarate reductase flavoprotein subunit
VVARGIFAEVRAGRGAFLDCRTAVRDFAAEFPTVYGYCQEAGIDPVTEMIPVIPAAHYFMGGIWTDIDGGPRCRASGPAASAPRPARTAPTGWRRTRCWRRWCFPPASPKR